MYTAAELVSLACQICNAPGRIVQAGKLLNMILANYALTIDLDTIRLTTTLSIGPQATIPYWYALPSNYLRAVDVFYNVLGQQFVCNQQPITDLDAEYTAQGIDNYPEWFTTDVSTSPPTGSYPTMAFYPPPAVPLTVTVRYRPTSLDIANPETSTSVPYFPDQLTLLKELCVQVGDVAGGDDRSGRWEAEVDRRMRKYLVMDDDKEGFAQTVKLDPRQFRNPMSLPPSKKLGF